MHQRVSHCSRAGDIMTKSVLEHHMLPFEEYGCYFEALTQNDTSELEQLFSKVSLTEKSLLLNGWFIYKNHVPHDKTILRRMTRPLIVAAMKGSTEAVKLLLKEGADLYQRNMYEENVVHSLVTASSLDLISEKTAVFLYKWLHQTMTGELMRKLLRQENVDELRPIEMAAHLGCILLYEAIQLTPEVYVTRTIKTGVITEEWIDVTEYESNRRDREKKSPLLLFAHLETDIVKNKKHGDLLNCDIVVCWMKREMRLMQTILYSTDLMFIIGFACFFVYITQPRKTQKDIKLTFHNRSFSSSTESLYFDLGQSSENFIVGTMILHALFHVLFGLTAYIPYIKSSIILYKHNLHGRKRMMVNYDVFIFLYITSNLCFTSATIFLHCSSSEYDATVNGLIFVSCMLSVSNFLFLMQVSSVVGHYAIAFNRMLTVLCQFLVLFLVIFLPFVHVFYRMWQENGGSPNSKFSSSSMEHYYNSFIVLLNMIDMTQFKADTGDASYCLLLFIHVAYVFILPILLINFLIALLSHSVGEVMENKELIVVLQQIMLTSIPDIFLYRFLGSLRNVFLRKCFHIEDNRVYLIRYKVN